MNVPLLKEHGFFTIWAIPATHDELCLSKVQNSISERGANPMIIATRAAQQPGLLVQKHSARGGGRICTGMRGFQSNTIKHTI
jgi:hypothetical protein